MINNKSTVVFSNEQIEEIIHLHNDIGLGCYKIAKIFNVARDRVRNALKKYGKYNPHFQKEVKWTDELLGKLKEVYPKLSNSKCARVLNVSENQVRFKARKLKLKKVYQPKTNIKLFEGDIVDHDFIYILGYFWADGTVSENNNAASLTIQHNDGIEIERIMLKIGFHQYLYDKSHKNRKNIVTYKVNCKCLHQFLIQYDFHKKSKCSADKILNKIPQNLHYLFFRGFLDGDGCISGSTKTGKHSVGFTGDYSVDWSFLKKYLNSLRVQFRLYKRESSYGNASSINVCGFLNTLKLLNDIYKNRSINGLGLTRKYVKYLNIIESCKKHVDYKVNVLYTPSYKKSNKKFVVYISHNGRVLPTKRFETFQEGLDEKMRLIKEYDTLEYKLRCLTNYWPETTSQLTPSPQSDNAYLPA